MSPNQRLKRLNAVKVANTLNKIEGVPVSQYAIELSDKWANGEISDAEMKSALIAAHKKT